MKSLLGGKPESDDRPFIFSVTHSSHDPRAGFHKFFKKLSELFMLNFDGSVVKRQIFFLITGIFFPPFQRPDGRSSPYGLTWSRF
jgi:hypothetical protein